jgi:PAS domain S-box-containing protein
MNRLRTASLARRVTSYAFAIFVTAAAVLLRWLLDPALGDSLPLVTLFGAVAVAVWVGGYPPALVACVLGYAACSWLFIEPRETFDFSSRQVVVGFAAYLFTCAVVITLGETMRNAQRRAREGRELLRVTLRSIGDAVITTDINGGVTYLNEVAESLTGWSLAEARGKPLDQVFRIANESSGEPVENPAMRALREGIIVGLANHTVLLRRDGSSIPIDDSAAPIKNEAGDVSGSVLIFRDVSAQRLHERDKAQQLVVARTLAAIVESSDDAIVSKSLNGTIESWNAGAERIFGHKAGHAIGRHISLVIPPERLAEEDEIISRLKRGERVEHFETERVRSDGTRIQVSLTISPLKDEDGHVIGASKIVRDVTERKRAEAELRALAADLSETDRRKNEFLATLAHELRNPLAPISNAVQILRRRGGGDSDAVDAATGLLERQVGHMARLVDDLLDMSRITRGHIELRREPVDLGVIVRQVVEATKPQFRAMNHQLTIALPDDAVMLHADPTRLAQVLGNLLNNASKFTDRDGHVSLLVEPRADDVEIRVRDSGIGIAAAELPKVFEMFTQLDNSIDRSRDGLGIGLTLVKNLVEMHGGSVSVSSEGPGRGSEFVVRLPVMKESVAFTEGSPTSPEAGSAPGRRVLIVDDNQDGATSLAMLLHLGGHETFVAHDGAEALAEAERLHPDVILLDIGLPGISGYEVCRRIRQQPWGKEMVMVALTGWGQEEDRERSRDAGFDAHVVKPVEPGFLATLLKPVATRVSAR